MVCAEPFDLLLLFCTIINVDRLYVVEHVYIPLIIEFDYWVIAGSSLYLANDLYMHGLTTHDNLSHAYVWTN